MFFVIPASQRVALAHPQAALAHLQTVIILSTAQQSSANELTVK